ECATTRTGGRWRCRAAHPPTRRARAGFGCRSPTPPFTGVVVHIDGGVLVRGEAAVEVDPLEGEHHHQTRTDDHARVGDVAHAPVRQSDEVHDRALERARVTEVTVHQIPRGPTHHQAECHRPPHTPYTQPHVRHDQD